MYEKITERSNSLDDRIDKFAELVCERYNLSKEELGDPASVTEEMVIVVGRIACDSEAKLNEASLVLESSRASGSGSRVPLKFDPSFSTGHGASGVSLFPGMILAARGKNGGGGWFTIQEVLDIPIVPSSPTVKQEPFTVIIANGPFVTETDSDFRFLSLQNLLKKFKDDAPAALVLLGPFIDSSHPSVESGRMSRDPAVVFAEHFGKYLKLYNQRCPSTRIILVSSVKDILNSHFTYPQRAMEVHTLNLPQSAVSLPNPSCFSLNGVRFGISTVDVLWHMKTEELFRKSLASTTSDDARNPVTRLCRNIVGQRSFYPLFPVPHDYSHETNLQVTQSNLLEFDSEDGHSPHVLILPSRFKSFNKIVDSHIVLNPPCISKTQSVMRIQYAPGSGPTASECFVVTEESVAARSRLN